MNTASVDLCKKLYQLSGWVEATYEHELLNGEHYTTTLPAREMKHSTQNTYIPAYDLGYLLRMLPKDFSLQPIIGASWHIEYSSRSHRSNIIKQADTPEDAACKLAIELFTRGILKRASE